MFSNFYLSYPSRYMDKLKLLGMDDPYVIPKTMWKDKGDFKNLIPPTKGHHITFSYP